MTTEVAPSEQPHEPSNWDFFWAAFVVWGSLVGIAVTIAVVVMVSRALSGSTTPPTAEEMMTPAIIAVSSGADFAITVVATWFFAAFRHRRRFRDALAITPVPRRTLAIAIAIGVLTPLGSFVLPQGEVSPIEALASTLPGLILISGLALASPFVEEIWYRGMFFPIARRWLGAIPAILIVAAWFGAMHAFQLRGDPSAALYIVGLGLIWTAQRHMTGSLIPGITSHFIHNAFVVAFSWISFLAAAE